MELMLENNPHGLHHPLHLLQVTLVTEEPGVPPTLLVQNTPVDLQDHPQEVEVIHHLLAAAQPLEEEEDHPSLAATPSWEQLRDQATTTGPCPELSWSERRGETYLVLEPPRRPGNKWRTRPTEAGLAPAIMQGRAIVMAPLIIVEVPAVLIIVEGLVVHLMLEVPPTAVDPAVTRLMTTMWW